MNDDAIHSTAPDQLEQSLQREAVERCAGVAVVIETPIEKNAAQPLLRLDEGTARIELDFAGGEIIVLVYRSARVDGAANGRSERGGRPVRSQIMLPISAVSPFHHRAASRR